MKQKITKKSFKGLLTGLGVLSLVAGIQLALAAPPPGATTAPYQLTYTAKLTNSAAVPVTTPQSVRFSIWTDSDWDAIDFDGAGNINPAAPGYAAWQETYTVTPNADGIFTVNLGSQATLPNFTNSVHLFLEVDVKPQASPNTAFEVLDPAGNIADTNDRKPINSSPYAINADTVDNRDAGNGPNNIPVLDGSGKLSYGVLPDGANSDTFTLDQDNNAPGNVITLQFGQAIAQYLRWNNPANSFELSNSLNINGNLSFTGGAAITGAVIDGGVNTIQNIPFSAIAPHAKQIRLSPAYDSAVLSEDGSDNKGTMKLMYEDLGPGNRHNFYNWSSNLPVAQDLDLVFRYQLPTEFVSFTATPITFTYQTSDAVVANNSTTITLMDTAGSPVTLVGATNLASVAWTDANITFAGAPTFTAGNYIEFRIKSSAIVGKYVRLGDIVLNYNAR